MGEIIRFTWLETAWGWMATAFSDLGLVSITLPCPSKEKAIGEILALWPEASPVEDALQELKGCLTRYFKGERVNFNFPLDLRTGTAFQKKVWEEVRSIPWGQTRTYGEVAARVGKPGAARAVGQALARNPLPIIIPCHRVIGASGNLTGFSGGIELKKKLLALERIIRL
ncbi:MAG: methylated-DNA--[protein]-cysteine S-methyltransferase [Anaerolineae bacterium]|nr:methylated-DNA--[protein]-cysteine S-methyltransferase [Anaerolineae bacterium]